MKCLEKTQVEQEVQTKEVPGKGTGKQAHTRQVPSRGTGVSETSASKPRWTWLKCAVAGEGKVQLHLLSQMLPHDNSATARTTLTSPWDA